MGNWKLCPSMSKIATLNDASEKVINSMRNKNNQNYVSLCAFFCDDNNYSFIGYWLYKVAHSSLPSMSIRIKDMNIQIN